MLKGGGGGVYSYICVLPNESLLKSVVFKFISKEISQAEHKYMNIQPPPPPPRINALVTPLFSDLSVVNIEACSLEDNDKLRLGNLSFHAKTEFNNCFIIYLKE